MSNFDVWGIKEEVATKVSRNINLKHGMFASVPLICKGDKCPYRDVCKVDKEDIVIDGRCPVEAGAIVQRFKAWCNHFAIEITDDVIKAEDLADVSLVKDLVENEVQIIRAENKIAMTGDFLALTIVDVDKYGDEHKELATSPEVKFKMELQDKKYKILQLLNATRKDKMKDLANKTNITSKGLEVFNKINQKLDEMKKIKKEESEE